MNDKSGTFAVLSSFCYKTPLHSGPSGPETWQPATRSDREPQQAIHVLPLFSEGIFRERGWSTVVSRTKPSLRSDASRIHRKLKEAGVHVGGGVHDWRHVRNSCSYGQEAMKPL